MIKEYETEKKIVGDMQFFVATCALETVVPLDNQLTKCCSRMLIKHAIGK